MKQVPIWKGGLGSIELITVARNEGEAINNLIEKEPILAAIGCRAEPFAPVDGCEIVALVPDKFVFGDDRRDKEEKARKAAEAKHEKAIKEAQEAEEKKIKEAQDKIDKDEAESEAKRKAEELKAIDEANSVDSIIDDILD